MLIAILSALMTPTTPLVAENLQNPDPRWVWCVSSEVDYGRNHAVTHVFSVPYHTDESAIELDYNAHVRADWNRPMGAANCTASLTRDDAVQLRTEFIQARRQTDNHYVSEDDWVWDGD